jgi:anti-sigma factor (TIGR02949 family)
MEAMQRMTCAEALRQLAAYLDRALTGEDLEALELHLQKCVDCCDKLDFSRKLDAFVKTRLPEGELPPDVEWRIRKALLG